jgi:hypothetical protein
MGQTAVASIPPAMHPADIAVRALFDFFGAMIASTSKFKNLN